MSTEGPSLPSPSVSSTGAFLTAPGTPGTLTEAAAATLPVLIALAGIFLLLASCLLFLALCKPALLDPSRCRAHECLPHHAVSPSEPQLQFWKRLGSLRSSLPSFQRGGPAPRRPLPGHDDSLGDSDYTDSTKM
ncbi:uncharacterized protein C10orf105 homolog [Octodon degus]|uniref:Uncharacterized protein C10orf105 homolog n=1 Tax=Octodon degus TaxID=10160 RepID=A0A6P6EPX3_OCTDE|nr:uncharacterized protein C10orf105 homolog [Octodon degus]XP_023574307.1 uncharacterized protein C10orf105 homolog [Octodon degus]